MSDEMSPRTKTTATAVIVDLQREVARLKDERAEWEDDLRAMSVALSEAKAAWSNWQREAILLRQHLLWLRQTVHQAHHEGDVEVCQKGTCEATTRLLATDFQGPPPATGEKP